MNDIGSDDLSRRELPFAQQTGQIGLCYSACTDSCDSRVCEHRTIILIALPALQLAGIAILNWIGICRRWAPRLQIRFRIVIGQATIGIHRYPRSPYVFFYIVRR